MIIYYEGEGINMYMLVLMTFKLVNAGLCYNLYNHNLHGTPIPTIEVYHGK